jgi:phosphoribosylaminoimidazole (AIR) synthetase
MDRVFNLGVGFCVICDQNYLARIVGRLTQAGVPAWPIGEVIRGEPGVEFVA